MCHKTDNASLCNRIQANTNKSFFQEDRDLS